MHIEPGLVDATKMFLSYATGTTLLVPLVGLGLLASAKSVHRLRGSARVERRLFVAA